MQVRREGISMNSRIIAPVSVALLAALTIVAGSPAQDEEPGALDLRTTFRTLLTFDNTDGAEPEAGLVQGTDGNFYGATNGGTVFKVTPQGKLTTLHTFNGTDGYDPMATLVLGTDGNFYGTTYGGGTNGVACSFGCGTVFKITSGGTLTSLYSFCAQPGCADGERPGGLAQGSDGNFYGTTEQGGSGSCACGTVFKITPAGALTTLYEFTGPDGFGPAPLAGLIRGSDGNFYGTTVQGGSGNACLDGCGTVFKITPQGRLTTLHNFTGTGGEGQYPAGTLAQARDGNFYGTTNQGGSNQNCVGPDGCGTVFRMTPQGTLTTLTILNSTEGSNPEDGLIQGTDGNFYATGAAGGGSCDCGAVFEVTPAGVLTRLHSFSTSSGYVPFAGLLQATNGTFYGTTFNSTPGYGSIYSLSVGLGPFVKSVPTVGKTGTTVKILGNNLLFATGVTFNGVAATFTAESSTYIQATVPTGATSGPVQVTLPNGTLTSSVNFQVLP